MGAVDFTEWVAPDLVVTLGERTYSVPPPSVAAARQVLAAALHAEHVFGLEKREIPPEVRAIVDSIGESHPALGSVYDQMAADGVPEQTINRVSVYALFLWARGKEYADLLARALWVPQVAAEASAGGAAPKG